MKIPKQPNPDNKELLLKIEVKPSILMIHLQSPLPLGNLCLPQKSRCSSFRTWQRATYFSSDISVKAFIGWVKLKDKR